MLPYQPLTLLQISRWNWCLVILVLLFISQKMTYERPVLPQNSQSVFPQSCLDINWMDQSLSQFFTDIHGVVLNESQYLWWSFRMIALTFLTFHQVFLEMHLNNFLSSSTITSKLLFFPTCWFITEPHKGYWRKKKEMNFCEISRNRLHPSEVASSKLTVRSRHSVPGVWSSPRL